MFTLNNPLAFTEKLVALKISGTFDFNLLIQTQFSDRKHLILTFPVFERKAKLTDQSVYLWNRKTYIKI